ncbi:MAG: hypothetical protein KA354_24970 [Phycisphaerae bacterium]|nr:hypothetical protein [Phycisphaerae bacterium]
MLTCSSARIEIDLTSQLRTFGLSGPSSGKTVSELPDWLTSGEVKDTIRAWLPYTSRPMSVGDAVESLLSYDRLLAALEKIG